MIKKSLLLLLLICSWQAFGWGITGHRTVGEVAQSYLSKKAGKKVSSILGGRTLAMVSNWMDEIKSDSAYDQYFEWHWVTIPEGLKYEDTEKNPKGDAIKAINMITAELKSGNLSIKQEKEYLMMLVHLVGDIHQPLHVGKGDDTGGNDVKVKWFWGNTNLHSVWDSKMIDGKEYSYKELAEVVKVGVTKDDVMKWQQASVEDWAYESMALRNQVYDLPDDMSIGYEYSYTNWETVQLRLVQAGVRLAGLLNDIYG